MCTICHRTAIYTFKSQYGSRHKCDLYISSVLRSMHILGFNITTMRTYLWKRGRSDAAFVYGKLGWTVILKLKICRSMISGFRPFWLVFFLICTRNQIQQQSIHKYFLPIKIGFLPGITRIRISKWLYGRFPSIRVSVLANRTEREEE
jgi:hypothetical protein